MSALTPRCDALGCPRLSVHVVPVPEMIDVTGFPGVEPVWLPGEDVEEPARLCVPHYAAWLSGELPRERIAA